MIIQVVDVYHSGQHGRPRAPFLLVAPGTVKGQLPSPNDPYGRWTFWKQVPINIIAMQPGVAASTIKQQGYYVQ